MAMFLFAALEDGSKQALAITEAREQALAVLPQCGGSFSPFHGTFEDRTTFEPRATLLRRTLRRAHDLPVAAASAMSCGGA